MNRLLPALILVTLGLISQQSQSQSAQLLDNNRLGWGARTVTAEGRVRVIITRAKPKLHLLKLPGPIARLFLDDTNDNDYNDLPDIQVGYRRPELVNQTVAIHDDISDEIKLRLLLARKRALETYTQTWG